MNYLRILRVVKGLKQEAEEYHGDDARSAELADGALVKAEKNRGAMAAVWDDLTAIIRMLKASATRRYHSMPWRSLSVAIVSLLYFISPIDALPDFIPVLGLMDDVFVITWAMRNIRRDLEKFRLWESAAA